MESRYQQAVALVTVEDAIVALGRPFNDHDFSQYPLDAPFPELGDLGANSQKGGSERIKQLARDEGLTLREVALRFSRPQRDFVGTPEQVADAIRDLVRERRQRWVHHQFGAAGWLAVFH